MSPKFDNSVETLEKLSMMFTPPPMFGTYDSICYRMSDLFLDGGVTSYIDLYDKSVTTTEGYSNFDINHESPLAKVSLNRAWLPPGTSLSTHESSSSLSSNSKQYSPFLDRSEISDISGSDVSCKMDSKKFVLDTENEPQRE